MIGEDETLNSGITQGDQNYSMMHVRCINDEARIALTEGRISPDDLRRP